MVGFELIELNHRHSKDCLLYNEDKAFHYAMNFLLQHKMRITFLISTYIDQNGTSIPTVIIFLSRNFLKLLLLILDLITIFFSRESMINFFEGKLKKNLTIWWAKLKKIFILISFPRKEIN